MAAAMAGGWRYGLMAAAQSKAPRRPVMALASAASGMARGGINGVMAAWRKIGVARRHGAWPVIIVRFDIGIHRACTVVARCCCLRLLYVMALSMDDGWQWKRNY